MFVLDSHASFGLVSQVTTSCEEITFNGPMERGVAISNSLTVNSCTFLNATQTSDFPDKLETYAD